MNENKQRDFFDQEKNQYAQKLLLTPPYHTVLELEKILILVKRISPSTIIDFGAGTGRTSIPLLQHGYHVIAVDISKKSLAVLRTTAEMIKNPKLETSEKLPEQTDATMIVGSDILHHVPLDTYLKRFTTVLKPGGTIAFSEPGALNPTWYIYLPICYEWSAEKGVTTCTLWNLKKKLITHGFCDIQITGIGLFPRSLLSFSKTLSRLNDWAGDLPFFKLFAHRYLIVAHLPRSQKNID